MGAGLQAKLLRVLQEQQFERIGSDRTMTVDVRVIAATNKDLAQCMADKSFREDLYYRLNVFPIHIPPLRDRRDDILPLAESFSKKISSRMGKPVASISPQAGELLHSYDWPGNARELANAIERALIVSQTGSIEFEDLPMKREPGMPELARPGLLAQIERTSHSRLAGSKQRRPARSFGRAGDQFAHASISSKGIRNRWSGLISPSGCHLHSIPSKA